jgi:hypothetical protein
LWHIESHVVPFGGSHVSPRPVSTQLSPHVDAVHVPVPLHKPPVHAVHFVAFDPV